MNDILLCLINNTYKTRIKLLLIVLFLLTKMLKVVDCYLKSFSTLINESSLLYFVILHKTNFYKNIKIKNVSYVLILKPLSIYLIINKSYNKTPLYFSSDIFTTFYIDS